MGKKKDNKRIVLEVGKGVKNQDMLVKSGFRNTTNEYNSLTNAITKRFDKLKKMKSVDGLMDSMKFNEDEIKDIKSFIKAYCASTESEQMAKLAKGLLIIGKTTFENLDDIVIDNELYQSLNKKYIDNGHDEPFAYMIGGDSRVKKATEFSTLVNNLNKGYTIRKNEALPAGVSKDNNVSIEEFLEEAYASIDLSREKELELEISPKIDGVSVNAGIINGKFESPLTRGDSEGSILLKAFEGYQITSDKDVINKARFGAQYEAFMTFENKERLSDEYGVDYKSNRGAANGVIMKSAKPDTFDMKQKEYVAFYPIDVEGLEFKNINEKQEFLKKMYVGPSDMIDRIVVKSDLSGLLEIITEAFKRYNDIRERLSYSIDGIVITILNKKIVDALGRKGRKNQYQIALKFEPKKAIGIIKSISFSTGKKGYKTVMAELKYPVTIDEKEFTKVAIGSLDKFYKLDLHESDKVEIVHVGDAMVGIDKVETNEHTGKKISLPEYCPDCGRRLEIVNNRIMCKNPKCDGMIAGKILNFFDVIGLVGYSDKSADKISHSINNIGDMLTMPDSVFDQIIKNGHVLREKIISALKTCDDADALSALGILDLGRETSIKILKKVSLDEICDGYNVNDLGVKIKTVPGIGDSIYNILENLKSEIPTLKEIKKYISKKANTREDVIKIATTNVSSDTKKSIKDFVKTTDDYIFVDSKAFDILVVDDYKVSSGKMDAAKKKGLEPKKGIYTMKDFNKMIDEKGGKENVKIKSEDTDNNINNEEVVNEEKVEQNSAKVYNTTNILDIRWPELLSEKYVS